MALSIGTKLGPYEVMGALGAGGMGEVYRARDSRLTREVALKVLPATVCADHENLRRFEWEARAAAVLNHPNIVAIYDVGSDAGRAYIITELLQGKTLREELMDGAAPAPKASGWGIQIAMGLAAAHEKGIVHRDLKPENIFITADGRAKILDFGLAKLVEKTTSAVGEANMSATPTVSTLPGTMLGSVGYMSPEQVRGENVDHRSDIFSLGAILYELFSGARAFNGTNAIEVLNAILKEEPEELTKIKPDIPPVLQRVIERALSKDPPARFDSARDVAFVLEAITKSSSTASPRARLEESVADVVQCKFALTDRVCRQLDRSSLDPGIIGDHLYYADNGVESDVLLCYLHGTGLDADEFSHLLHNPACRAVAPTLYGFDRHHPRRRIRLRIADHLVILREWLRYLVEKDRIKAVVLVGFSTGADLWMQYASEPMFDRTLPIAGLIALDANVSYQTCWVTRILAQLRADAPAQIIEKLQPLSAGTKSLNEWLNVHEYLVQVLRKFESSLEVLTQFAAEIVHPFENTGLEVFAERFRRSLAVIPHVRCIFSEAGPSHRDAIAAVKLANLDTGLLGQAYSEDSIVMEYDADHFELLEPSRLKRHLDPIVEGVRGRRIQ